MPTIDSLEFVNRGAELEHLKACLERTTHRPALVVIRSPSGFGKSTLTDQLPNLSSLIGRSFCMVDPNIRGRIGGISLHDGFFIQRLAESLNSTAQGGESVFISFSEFLQVNKTRSAQTKDPIDALSELPSLRSAYKLAFDYAARAFAFGKYSPKKLLISDEAHAIAICSAYVQKILSDRVITLIIREAQHIDLRSLRTLLLWTEKHPGPDLILEYTTDTGNFEPEHQKLILKNAERRGGLDILDLVRLGADHLEFLIRANVKNDFELNSDFYLSWDGNLRSIVELKFQVGIGHSLTNGRQISRALSDLTDTLVNHVSGLSSLYKMVLAVVASHIEAIDRTTLLSVLSEIEPHSQQTAIVKALEELENVHSFLGTSGGAYAIRNDTVANALLETQSMKALMALADRALRDHYRKIIEGDFGSVGLAESVRQYFRLCARTKDATSLIDATEMLNGIIQLTSDQSIYVDVVASAIEADRDLYSAEHDALVEWAAGLAYESSDWRRTLSLVNLIPQPSPFATLLKACSLQECGGHDEALQLMKSLRQSISDPSVVLATKLVEALIEGCRGEELQTRNKLRAIVTDPVYEDNPLLGYAYRFFEIVENRENGLINLQTSAKLFDKHLMLKSKAYSQLAAAILLARTGEVSAARALAQEAVEDLSDEVRDQHIILNNLSAIELLSNNPDFNLCSVQLNSALRFAGDDFSEVTILSNLGIVYLELGDIESSIDCAEKCRSILQSPDFVDTGIFWPVCFNISQTYGATGDEAKRVDALEFAKKNAIERTDSTDYWKYRYGSIKTPPENHAFMLRKPWHPAYLSHWLIDLEGLILLREEPTRSLAHMTVPSA